MVAVFASSLYKWYKEYDLVPLSFSTSEDDTTHTADEHKTYMGLVLFCYNMTWENDVAIIGDSCFVGAALSRNVWCALVECAGHRYNVAIMDDIDERKELLLKE